MIIHPGGKSATFFSKKQFFYLRRAMCNAFCIADTEAYIARRCPLVFEVVEFLITARIIDTPAHGFGGIQISPSFLQCQYAPILLTGYYSAQRRQAKTLQRIQLNPSPCNHAAEKIIQRGNLRGRRSRQSPHRFIQRSQLTGNERHGSRMSRTGGFFSRTVPQSQ